MAETSGSNLAEIPQEAIFSEGVLEAARFADMHELITNKLEQRGNIISRAWSALPEELWRPGEGYYRPSVYRKYTPSGDTFGAGIRFTRSFYQGSEIQTSTFDVLVFEKVGPEFQIHPLFEPPDALLVMEQISFIKLACYNSFPNISKDYASLLPNATTI